MLGQGAEAPARLNPAACVGMSRTFMLERCQPFSSRGRQRAACSSATLLGLDCANTPRCGWSWPQIRCDFSHLSWMQEVQPALEPTSTVDLALMTLLRAERVTLQHLQALLTALIQTDATEMWVQVRALCCTVARSMVALLCVCPSHVPVY